MPTIIKQSISILSDAGLGMAMFSLGEWSSFNSAASVLLIIVALLSKIHY